MHECVLSAASLKKASGVKALDVAKRLLEEGFHSPTVYFPLIVDEALMLEPTETESLQTLEALATAFERIAAEARDRAGPNAPPRHPTPPRCAGWTRRGRRGRSFPPSTPVADGRRAFGDDVTPTQAPTSDHATAASPTMWALRRRAPR